MQKMYSFLVTAIVFVVSVNLANSQNVGIGTNTPRGPLSFGTATGQKIILWDDGNAQGHYYGIGVQSGTLQLHSYTFSDDIVFGYGSSANFTERMRIRGAGQVGIGTPNPQFILDVANRIRLRPSGAETAGMWLSRADLFTQAFIGMEDDTWAGIYGSNSGWNLGVNTINGDIKLMGRVGIGTTTPNAPLTFPPSLGKKITLYPGGTGDVGMAVQGNLLQIYSDNPNADIAFGYDQAGIMTERFRVRSTGALRLNGNAGAPGQVLQSNGDGAASNWVSSTNTLYNNTVEITNNLYIDIGTSNGFVPLPGMTYSFTTTGNAKAFITYSISTAALSCAFCGSSSLWIDVVYNGGRVQRINTDVTNASNENLNGTKILQIGPGNHTISLNGQSIGPTARFGGTGTLNNYMNIQIIPQ